MGDSSSIYEILIKFGLDDAKAKEAVARINEVGKASESLGKKSNASTESTNSAITALGNKLKGLAAGYLSINAVLGMMSHSVNQYTQQAGTSEEISRQWLSNTQEIEFATTNLGRTTTAALLPVYNNITKAIRDNIIPALQDAIELTGNVVEWVNNQYEQRGKEGIDLLGAIQSNMDQSYEEYAKQYADILRKYQPSMSPEQFKQYANQMMAPSEFARAQAYYERTGKKPVLDTGTEGTETEDTTYKAIQEYEMMLRYKRQEEEASKSYENQKYRMRRDFDRQELYATEDFNRQRYRTLRDFNMQIQYSESEFYRQRAISLRDFNISLSRSEYDYQLSRKRATEDHNFSLKQIMLSGDALSYYYSQRQFNIEKKRAEEDYQLQRKRSQEDFTRSQNDQLVQYQISRAFQLKQFEISLEDQEYDFKLQRKRALEQYKIQQNDMYYNFVEQRRIRENAFRAEYERLQTNETRLANLKAQFTNAEIKSFEMLAAQGREFVYDLGIYLYQLKKGVYGTTDTGGTWTYNSGNNTVTAYAEGGYTKSGLAYTHDDEFVLTAKTTKAVERIARGNQLTQESVIQALSGTGGLNYVDNRQFSRGLSADEKIMLKQEFAQMVKEAFT